jgi:hypothetical protein
MHKHLTDRIQRYEMDGHLHDPSPLPPLLTNWVVLCAGLEVVTKGRIPVRAENQSKVMQPITKHYADTITIIILPVL